MELSESAKQIITKRYLLEGEETRWEELATRVGNSIAEAELPEKRGAYAESFADLLKTLKFIPGGRILRNAGRQRGSLFNCYHLPIGDSIDEIGDCASNALKLWADGGGVGINFSTLRPADALIQGIKGRSSGLVSFMRAIDGLAACIESGGSRRAASLGSCDVSHPEIENFIDAKLVDGSISYFNISVNITKSFLEAVLAGGEWPLTFRGKVYKTVKAVDLWWKILNNMVNVAEPGMLIWDNLIKNNSYYFAPITGTNPCLTGDTLIQTTLGNLPIKELTKYKTVDVYTRGEHGGLVIKPAHFFRTKTKARCITVNTTRGVVKCTPNHKFITPVGEIEAQYLKAGQPLIGLLRRKLNETHVVSVDTTIFHEPVFDGTVEDTHCFFANGVLVHNCGEACLAPYDVCDLGSIVLPSFIEPVSGRTRWQDLERTITLAVRFLDNVIDVNKYRLEANRRMAYNGRRIGLGVMGLAEYLFAKEVRYGSNEALKETAEVLKCLRDTAYNASVELAKEKGAFPAYEKVQYHKASFIRHLPAAIRRNISTHSIRNVTLLALAPTGTISLIPEVSGSIEPLFSKAYKRADRLGDRLYVHPITRRLIDNNVSETPSWFVATPDLSTTDHLDMQSLCQKYIDGAVSKTINIKEDTTAEDLSPILFEYLYDIKGVTVYRDGSRSGQVLNHVTIDEARDYVKKHKDIGSTPVPESTECASGACEI